MSPTTTYTIKPAKNGYIFTHEEFNGERWTSDQLVFTTYEQVLEYLTDNKF